MYFSVATVIPVAPEGQPLPDEVLPSSSTAQTAVGSKLSIMTSESKLANILRFIFLPPVFIYILPVSTGWVYIVLHFVLPAQMGQPQRCLPALG